MTNFNTLPIRSDQLDSSAASVFLGGSALEAAFTGDMISESINPDQYAANPDAEYKSGGGSKSGGKGSSDSGTEKVVKDPTTGQNIKLTGEGGDSLPAQSNHGR